jgi:hypothetical protein
LTRSASAAEDERLDRYRPSVMHMAGKPVLILSNSQTVSFLAYPRCVRRIEHDRAGWHHRSQRRAGGSPEALHLLCRNPVTP